MNLVWFALRRSITLLTIVAAAALAGFLALDRMARDIFPDLGVPVLYVAQPYGALDPAQMEGFITNYYEYHFLYITGIEHVESKSICGALHRHRRLRRVEPPVALFDAASALVAGNGGADMVRASSLACSGDFLLRLALCQSKHLITEGG
jgi:hypothetical protein